MNKKEKSLELAKLMGWQAVTLKGCGDWSYKGTSSKCDLDKEPTQETILDKKAERGRCSICGKYAVIENGVCNLPVCQRRIEEGRVEKLKGDL